MNEKRNHTGDSHAAKGGGTGAFTILIPFLLAMLVQVVCLVFAAQIAVVDVLADFSGSTYAEFVGSLSDVLLLAPTQGLALLLYSIVVSIWFGSWYRKTFSPAAEAALSSSQGLSDAAFRESSVSAPGTAEGAPVPETEKRISPASFLNKRVVRLFAGGFLFCVGAQYASVYLMNALAMRVPSWLEIYEELLETAGMTGQTQLLTVIIYTVFTGPIAEELIFRGLTFGYARRLLSFFPACLLQALFFALYHGNILQGIIAFLMAMLFGYLLEETDSILLVCLLHMGYNTLGLFGGDLIYPAATPYGFFLFLLGGMIAAYLGVLLLTGKRRA